MSDAKLSCELVIRDVHKAYGKTPVLKGVDLTVPAGCTTAIVGPSGCGKSTLLRIIAGFLTADAGSVHLGDADLLALPVHQRGIGYLPQEGALLPFLDVAGNIIFGLSGVGVARKKRRYRALVEELLEQVSLPIELAARMPHELSGGQQQRVALARALAPKPKLLLLDEPFSALDAGLKIETRAAVRKILDDAGMTSILVTHDQAEALSFASEVAVFNQGRLEQTGAPETIYHEPNTLEVAEFLGRIIRLDARVADGWAHTILGRMPVTSPAPIGIAHTQVMIRPDQIRVRENLSDEAAAGSAQPRRSGVAARVVRKTFYGSHHELEVQVEGQNICFEAIGVHAQVGDTVQLELRGAAILISAR